MTALLLVIVAIRMDVLSESIAILEDNRNKSNSQLRMATVDRLHKYALLESDSVVGYYQIALHATLQPGSVNLWLLVTEMTAHPDSSSRLLSALCDHIERWPHLLPSFLKKVYTIDKAELVEKIKSRLSPLVKKKYREIYDSKSAELADVVLRNWLDMCLCRSILRDRKMISACEEGLKDKRVIVDITKLAELPNERPLPTRVCDFCMLDLLYYSQADISSVFNLNGMRDLRDESYSQLNTKMFDDVIRDRGKYINLK